MKSFIDPDYIPPPTLELAHKSHAKAEKGTRSERLKKWRYLATNDFWFSMRYVYHTRKFICRDTRNPHHGKNWYDHPFLFDICREIQAEPDGFLDLWPRQFLKTTTITQGLTKWDLMREPWLRIAIITYKVEGTGERFFLEIKEELETNDLLKGLFPDVLWGDAAKEAKTWNNSSIVVKRPRGAREPSVSVFGLVGSQAVSQHFDILVYDDIVTRDNAYSQTMISKTTDAWKHSAALGGDETRYRYVGTRWSMHDSYDDIIKSGVVQVRRRDLYDELGNPTLRSRGWIEEMQVMEGPVNFAAQFLNNPIAEGQQVFDMSWRKFYDEPPEDISGNGSTNVYILIDPARVTKKDTDPDYTVIAVVGVQQGSPRKKFFLLDLIRDRLPLEKTDDILFNLVEKWDPNCVLLERIGADVRLEHIKMEMNSRGLHFRLYPFFEHSGIGKIKAERIKRLQTSMAAGDWYFPSHGIFKCVDGVTINILDRFYQEEMQYWTPDGGSRHDDILDTLSWVHSPAAKYLVVAPRRIGRQDGVPWSTGKVLGRPNQETTSWAV